MSRVTGRTGSLLVLLAWPARGTHHTPHAFRNSHYPLMPEADDEFHGNEWSQTIIDYLADSDDGTVSLDALIEHIIDQETNPVAADRVTVSYEVVHVCLPKLEENGVVKFNERTETIKYQRPTA